MAEDNEILALDTRAREGYVPNALKGYLSESKSKALWHRQAKSLAYPVAAGYNDPLTHMCVLDLVMRLRPDDVIRSKYLAEILKWTHNQLVWNATVVGVVLAEISEVCEENFTDRTQRPIIRSRDGDGYRWKLNPTTEGWRWLQNMRDFIGAKAELWIKLTKQGAIFKRDTSVWFGLEPRIPDETSEPRSVDDETTWPVIYYTGIRSKERLETAMSRGNIPTSILLPRREPTPVKRGAP